MTIRDVEIDTRVYPLTVIRKTAAALSARISTQIAQRSDDIVTVTFFEGPDRAPLETAIHDFRSLLADLCLQEQIAEQTRDIRLALVRAALAEALAPPSGKS